MPVPVKQCVSSRRLSGVKFTIDVTFGSKFNSQHVTRLWAVAIRVRLRYSYTSIAIPLVPYGTMVLEYVLEYYIRYHCNTSS